LPGGQRSRMGRCEQRPRGRLRPASVRVMVCWLAERPGPATVRDATEHVLDWIRSGPRDRRHVAWQSYNVSERMVHWLLLLLVAETQAPLAAPEAATIRESILCQADHLLGHLEYHGPDRTNNHLLNNGRALYMA